VPDLSSSYCVPYILIGSNIKGQLLYGVPELDVQP